MGDRLEQSTHPLCVYILQVTQKNKNVACLMHNMHVKIWHKIVNFTTNTDHIIVMWLTHQSHNLYRKMSWKIHVIAKLKMINLVSYQIELTLVVNCDSFMLLVRFIRLFFSSSKKVLQ